MGRNKTTPAKTFGLISSNPDAMFAPLERPTANALAGLKSYFSEALTMKSANW
jgi:hypothetical protein